VSCGGANDGSGRSTGFGGLVSATATQYGVKVSEARKFAHSVISARRAEAENYPDPSQEEVVTVLSAATDTLTRGRDRYDQPPEGKDSGLTSSEKMWVRWNGYREAVAAERDKHVRGEKKLPGGVEFSVWKDIPGLMRQQGRGYRCASCGEFASYDIEHTCPSAAAEQQAIAVDLLALEKQRSQALQLSGAAHRAPEPEPVQELVPVGAGAVAATIGSEITPTSLQPAAPSSGAVANPHVDDQLVGATNLGGMTVGELKQWIRVSQAYAFAAGQNSAPPTPPTSAPAPAPSAPPQPPPQPPPTSPASDPQSRPPSAFRRWASRMWRRMTGQHKCSTCGQFLPESGGHACPGPAASTTTAGSPPTPPGQGQPVTGPIPGQPSPGQGQPSPNPNPDPQPSPQPSVAPSMDSEPPIRGRDRAALGWGVGWRSGIGVGAVALTAGTVFAPFMLPVALFAIWRAWKFRGRYLESIGR